MGSCPLDEKEQGYMKFYFGMDDGPAESRLGGVDDIVLGVCLTFLFWVDCLIRMK